LVKKRLSLSHLFSIAVSLAVLKLIPACEVTPNWHFSKMS